MRLGKVVGHAEMAVEGELKEGCCNKASLGCFALEFASLAFEGGIALGSCKEACSEGSSYKRSLGWVVVEGVIELVVAVALGFDLVCCTVG